VLPAEPKPVCLPTHQASRSAMSRGLAAPLGASAMWGASWSGVQAAGVAMKRARRAGTPSAGHALGTSRTISRRHYPAGSAALRVIARRRAPRSEAPRIALKAQGRRVQAIATCCQPLEACVGSLFRLRTPRGDRRTQSRNNVLKDHNLGSSSMQKIPTRTSGDSDADGPRISPTILPWIATKTRPPELPTQAPCPQ